MTDRQLSERLSLLADRIEEISESDSPNWFRDLKPISLELRTLSNEKYTPGSVSWEDVKKKMVLGQKKFPF